MRYWEDPFVAPVPGCFTSPFGVKRVRNGKPTGDYHRGVDQRSPTGYPVRAVAAGVIKIAQQFTALGGTVGLDHGQGLETMYLHMSSLLALPSAHVNRGDVIGYVGSTGRSNGPHLHWAIYVNGVPVNPSQWVTLRPCSASASRVRPITKGFPFERNLPPSYRLSSSSNLVCAVKVSNRIYTLTRTDEEKSTGGVNP